MGAAGVGGDVGAEWVERRPRGRKVEAERRHVAGVERVREGAIGLGGSRPERSIGADKTEGRPQRQGKEERELRKGARRRRPGGRRREREKRW